MLAADKITAPMAGNLAILVTVGRHGLSPQSYLLSLLTLAMTRQWFLLLYRLSLKPHVPRSSNEVAK